MSFTGATRRVRVEKVPMAKLGFDNAINRFIMRGSRLKRVLSVGGDRRNVRASMLKRGGIARLSTGGIATVLGLGVQGGRGHWNFRV